MVSNHIDTMRNPRNLHSPASAGPVEILSSLVPVAAGAANAQLDAFALRLADALMAFSEQSLESKQANLCFTGAGLLRKNTYAYYHLATSAIADALRLEMQAVLQQIPQQLRQQAPAEAVNAELALVSYEDMDNKVRLGHIARPIVTRHVELLEALNLRFAALLGRDDFQLAQNPFRPEVFLGALNAAWADFNPEAESHPLLLPLLQPEVFLDMAPILQALNDALVGHGILPALGDSYRIRKSTNYVADQKREAQIAEGLRRMLTGEGGAPAGGGMTGIADIAGGMGGIGGMGGGLPGAGAAGIPGGAGVAGNLQSQLLQVTAVSNQLMGFLAGMQKTMLDRQLAGVGSGDHGSTAVLADIKRQAPAGALSQVDENTIDLLTSVFDLVFRDQNIATEMKSLIGFLQVPVLKAALIDKDFFFKQEHPARRLVESLAQSSMEWDGASGQQAPVYQTMKRIVERVQQDFDKQMSVFSEVLSELQGFIQQEEYAATETLQAPISKALRKEKIGQATKVAKNEVALRVGTGEVVAFVETFLENKWVPVLTVAYTLQEEKPTAVQNAVSTMDDLIWSVKPKITMAQRKELLAKLPSILARLNKWLTVVKWEEADRTRFFADLAETHASIVRAPLPLTPERQLELAVAVAKEAAERRLEKQASAAPEPQPDDYDEQVKNLERGIWLNFTDAHGGAMKAKLSWSSPMKSLFIFTTHRKEQTFQLTDAALAQRLREGSVQTVSLDRLVDRALDQVFASGANDPEIAKKSAA
ncbi:DUF1631 family protein [Noviherbaspirillum sedimenti]|uniref:DUF1631 family protein n=1 Tax=Noviherbaspirillum sedimenti TaxID=2320865 RepID=A0A3A3G181_9BURK|nr:DUF1631 family protein [Noviherbaspirillum sedimenti]RJG00222.1 DUF1631 family protein [Noviherbaspirillum sedimenti]